MGGWVGVVVLHFSKTNAVLTCPLAISRLYIVLCLPHNAQGARVVIFLQILCGLKFSSKSITSNLSLHLNIKLSLHFLSPMRFYMLLIPISGLSLRLIRNFRQNFSTKLFDKTVRRKPKAFRQNLLQSVGANSTKVSTKPVLSKYPTAKKFDKPPHIFDESQTSFRQNRSRFSTKLRQMLQKSTENHKKDSTKPPPVFDKTKANFRQNHPTFSTKPNPIFDITAKKIRRNHPPIFDKTILSNLIHTLCDHACCSLFDHHPTFDNNPFPDSPPARNPPHMNSNMF